MTKFEVFADEINVAALGRVENIVGKELNASYWHPLDFSSMFSKAFSDFSTNQTKFLTGPN